MTGTPNKSLQVARRASKRLGLARFVELLGHSLVFGAGAGVVAAGLGSWLFGVQAGLIGAVVCLLVAGAVAAIGSMMRRRTLLLAAARVDDRLALKDRLSTAIELGNDLDLTEDPFVSLAVADAERTAVQADIRRAVPVRVDRSWIIWPMLGAVGVGVAFLVPMLDRSHQPSVDPERVARTQETIASVGDEIEQAVLDQTDPEPAAEEALERIREIERELESGLRTPEDAATEAAAVAQEQAERMAEDAQSDRTESLEQQLEQIEPEELGDASALAEALREADMVEAQRVLREMVDEAQTQEERQKLAENLRRLAEQIRPEQGAEPEPGAPDDFSESLEPAAESDPPEVDQPGETGDSTEPVDESASEPKPDEPSVEDPQGGGSPSTPDQAAREQSERAAREASEREAGRRDADELADRLDEVADRVENPEPGPSEKPSQDQDQPGEEQPPGPQPTAPGEMEPQPTQKPSDNANPDESERGGPQGEPDANTQREQRQDGSDESQQPQPGQDQQGTGEQNKSDAQSSDQQQDQSGSEKTESEDSPADQPGETRTDQAPPGSERSQPEPGAEPGDRGFSDSGKDQPNQGDTEQPGETPPDRAADSGSEKPDSSGLASDDPERTSDSSEPTDSVREPGVSSQDSSKQGSDEQSGDAIDKALDQMEKLDRQQRDALKRQAQSEQMRKRAEELLGKASPEQRRRLADLANRFQGDHARDKPSDNWNPETELFDARPKELAQPDSERAVGSTEPSGVPDRTARGGSFRPAYRPTEVREAAAAAEKAIEGQAIPRRYRDYVRKVYRRFEQAAASREAAPEGQDAEPEGGSDADGSGS